MGDKVAVCLIIEGETFSLSPLLWNTLEIQAIVNQRHPTIDL